jgi:hypothetical protein
VDRYSASPFQILTTEVVACQLDCSEYLEETVELPDTESQVIDKRGRESDALGTVFAACSLDLAGVE